MPINWDRLDERLNEISKDGMSHKSLQGFTKDAKDKIIKKKLRTATSKDALMEAGKEFIRTLNGEASFAQGMTPRAYAALTQWKVIKKVEYTGDSFVVGIKYAGSLRRPSVQPEMYDGVYNIVSLLDMGYYIPPNRSIGGWWGDEYIRTRTEFSGYHFIRKAINTYMLFFSEKYNVKSINARIIDDYDSYDYVFDEDYE